GSRTPPRRPPEKQIEIPNPKSQTPNPNRPRVCCGACNEPARTGARRGSRWTRGWSAAGESGGAVRSDRLRGRDHLRRLAVQAGGASGAGGVKAWQGVTTAQWVMAAGGGRGRGGPRHGSIKSVTTQLRPGYLRKNGVPYSDRTTMTEYWDLHTETNGDEYLVD